MCVSRLDAQPQVLRGAHSIYMGTHLFSIFYGFAFQNYLYGSRFQPDASGNRTQYRYRQSQHARSLDFILQPTLLPAERTPTTYCIEHTLREPNSDQTGLSKLRGSNSEMIEVF
jgi:hypothetical protein